MTPPRPRRGTPAETRTRLVEAAAEVFNRDGYDGTDSNRLARHAGYAPGTFYKHFADKREIFLAVYAEWVSSEWREVTATLASAGSPAARAERIVDSFLAHHRRWRGFRASLRALVSLDPEVRRFYREQRNRQLDLLARKHGSREADALLLYTLERTADGLAEDEHVSLGLKEEVLRGMLVELVRARVA